ncbi:hypothetical protein Nans01_03690 [Nocardiopsis ansamitocini]|uniref:Uncharacterized protein n=1 Tax=Nocardiopsis ansamitocini TaxID=1670832 RepID=A0A9W6P2M8_9ACTN|nr:hypothetical protein Nans01_03690 [Nocardiopsis ansamitocini]
MRAWLSRAHRQWVFCAKPVGEVVLKPPTTRPDPSPVAPVRLAPESELAASARRSPFLVALRALADWAEEHRPRVVDGRPEPGPAARALRELPAVRPVAHDGDVQDPDMAWVWNTAFDTGLLTMESGRARRTPELGGGDSDPLTLRHWLAVYVALTEFDEDTGHGAQRVAERVLGEFMFELYQCGRAVQPESGIARLAAEVLDDAVTDGLVDATETESLSTLAQPTVRNALGELIRHGAVTRPSAVGVELTALGRWGLNRLLNASGMTAPVLGGHAHAEADELLAALSGYSESERAVEFLGWLAERTEEDAAAGLIAAAARAGTGQRGIAVVLLGRLGPGAEPAVRAGLADPLMWRHCRQWLAGHAIAPVPPLCDTDRAWLVAEAVVGLSHQRGLQDYTRLLDRLIGPRELPLVALLADLDHPDRARALELLFQLHPDPHISVAARHGMRR